MSIDFKGSYYPKDVILYAMFFCVRYAVSYRDLEEIMAERGVQVGHPVLLLGDLVTTISIEFMWHLQHSERNRLR